MKLLVLALTSLLLLFIQTNLLRPSEDTFLVRPDLLLLLVLFWGLRFGQAQGLVAAAIAGVLLDSTSSLPTGGHLLALVPIVLVAAVARQQPVASRTTLGFFLTCLATFIYYLILALVLQITGRPLDWLGSVVSVMLPAMLINALLSPLFLLWTDYLGMLLGQRRLSPTLRRPERLTL